MDKYGDSPSSSNQGSPQMRRGPPVPPPKKRSSLQTANAERNQALLTLQERVNALEEEIEAKVADPENNPMFTPPKDTLEEKQLEGLNTPPDERETAHIDALVDLLGKNAADFVQNLSEDQQTDIARSCLYHYMTPGTVLCEKDEETNFYFVVLRGSVVLEELQVHHQESAKGGGSNTRVTNIKAGRGFHHFPLVMQYRFYGYSARVEASAGASVLVILKTDYIHILRRSMEKEMNDTVSMLKATPFFSTWSETSMARLYYWFDRRKLAPETDVVKQGDDADFCFIIRSGRCDVLVEVKEEEKPKEEGEAAEGAAPAPKGLGAFGKGKMSGLLKKATAAQIKANNEGHGIITRANMRHIVTLRPGAIVGEIALFKDGVKRMATVRTSDNVELLILDKKSFLDLDRATLHIISENARYNAACTKEPHQRTRDDLQILQQRTSHLSHLSSLSTDVHLELCRVMRYRKVNEGSMLVRKGSTATCLYVIISGKCNTFAQEPRRRFASMAISAFTDNSSNAALRKRSVGVDMFAGMKPTSSMRAGDAVGEEELLQENPMWLVTAITTEPMELMEIDRKDFDRILKADRTSERGRLIEFLTSLSMMEGISVAAVHGLSNHLQKKSFMRGQLCLAHPPAPELTSASFSYDYVYLIFSGEARLVAGADISDEGKKAPPPLDVASSEYGPLVETTAPNSSRVERHLGHSSIPVATLGPGECISDNLLPHAGSRWCLAPITQLELLVIPRKDFHDTLRASSLSELRELASIKSTFFQQHLEHTVQQTAAMHAAGHSPKRRGRDPDALSRSPRKGAAGLIPPPPRPRNAYEPIGSPRSPSPRLPPLDDTAGSFDAADGGSPRKKGDGMPPMPGSPKIRLSKGSNVPTIRAHG